MYNHLGVLCVFVVNRLTATISLTTDFGAGSAYVAAIKGVILCINPDARIVDLSHSIPPQDLRFADFFLASTIPFFPPDVLHVVVVDPGVGSARRLLYVEAAGNRLLVPDNGCWTSLARLAAGQVEALALTSEQYWRHPVSPTFHGRDILAPVAAQLSLGLQPEQLGPPVTDWITLQTPEATLELGGQQAKGEVIFVDPFGNLITNIPAAMVDAIGPAAVRIGDQTVTRRVRTYAEAPKGSLVTLISSYGTLEIAVVEGNAAERLKMGVGSAVTVHQQPTV
jgi:S-adenosyl-L-methionine hydrolase (adenosine-forming)